MKKSKGQSAPTVAVFGMLFVALVVIGFVAILVGVDTVPASHYGVMEQFGKIKGVQEPGIKWTGPFTSVEKYDLRTTKVIVDLQGENCAVDKTGQSVYATVNVNYRIKKSTEIVRALYEEVGKSDVVADKMNLNAIIAEGFKQATVRYDALEILDKRQEVKELAKDNIRSNFPTDYFEIQNIVITNIDFSTQFKQAIEDKKTAEQEAIKEENLLEVVRYQQEQKILEYEAEALRMRIQSQEVTALLNQQKWIEKWDGSLPDYMIMGENTGDFILQIPIIPEKEEQ